MSDPRTYAWAGLWIAILAVFRAIPSGPTHHWISSDTLWPVHLFIDVFEDGFSFEGWSFSIAACWAPDILLVGLCYFFIRNPTLTTFAAGALQFIIFLAGLMLIWRALELNARKLLDTCVVGVAIAVTLWIALNTEAYYPPFYKFLLPQTHVGNLIMHVYAVGLALLLTGEVSRQRLLLAAYFVTCAAAGFSNAMFFAHTAAALTLGFAVLVATGMMPFSRAAALAAIGWVAALFGAASSQVMLPGMRLTDQSSFGLEAWRTAWHTFHTGAVGLLLQFDLQHVAAVAWVLACIVASAILIARRRQVEAGEGKAARARLLFFVTSAASSILGPVAVIAGGSNGLTVFKDYVWTMHYLHPTFFLPLFTWPIFIGMAPGRLLTRFGSYAAALGAAIAIALPLKVYASIPAPAVSLGDYAPDYIRALDTQAEQHGLKYGVSGYWQARLITLLSRKGLRVYPVDGMLRPFGLVANHQWFRQTLEVEDERPCFSFVVLNDPLWNVSLEGVTKQLGEPDRVLDAAGTPAAVYLEESGGRVEPSCMLSF